MWSPRGHGIASPYLIWMAFPLCCLCSWDRAVWKDETGESFEVIGVLQTRMRTTPPSQQARDDSSGRHRRALSCHAEATGVLEATLEERNPWVCFMQMSVISILGGTVSIFHTGPLCILPDAESIVHGHDTISRGGTVDFSDCQDRSSRCYYARPPHVRNLARYTGRTAGEREVNKVKRKQPTTRFLGFPYPGWW